MWQLQLLVLHLEVESYEFDEKVPYAWSQETDKYKKFYGKVREEVERENLLNKFESQGELGNKKFNKVIKYKNNIIIFRSYVTNCLI